jgi:hypothetical protein
MIFKLSRESGLPIVMEEDEVHTIKTLEAQGRWTEVEDYCKELRQGEDLKVISIEADTMEELKLFLTTLEDDYNFIINFKHKTIVIEDGGTDQ